MTRENSGYKSPAVIAAELRQARRIDKRNARLANRRLVQPGTPTERADRGGRIARGTFLDSAFVAPTKRTGR